MAEQAFLRHAYWLDDHQKAYLARQAQAKGILRPYDELIVLKPETTSTTGMRQNPGATEVSSGFKDVETGVPLRKTARKSKKETAGH